MGPVSLVEAARFLVNHYGPTVAGVEPVGRGEWSRAYAFRCEGRELDARFGQHVEDFEKDRIAASHGTPDLPIPPVLEIGQALGGWYAVSERAHGRFIDDLSGDGMRATLPSLFAALDVARAADLSGTSGYGGWGADGDAPYAGWREALLAVATDWSGARITGWRQRLADSASGIGPFDEAAARLAELVAECPEERHLIHSDLLHWNLLVDGDRISAVVDWGCALYGDFLYDVAWIAFWAPWFPAWDGIDWASEAASHFDRIGLDVPSFDERLRACQIHIGLANLRYSTWKGDWDQVEEVTARTLAIASE